LNSVEWLLDHRRSLVFALARHGDRMSADSASYDFTVRGGTRTLGNRDDSRCFRKVHPLNVSFTGGQWHDNIMYALIGKDWPHPVVRARRKVRSCLTGDRAQRRCHMTLQATPGIPCGMGPGAHGLTQERPGWTAGFGRDIGSDPSGRAGVRFRGTPREEVEEPSESRLRGIGKPFVTDPRQPS